MECCATLVRTDVSEERIAFIIRVRRITELGTTLTATSTFLRNIGSYRRNIASHPRRRYLPVYVHPVVTDPSENVGLLILIRRETLGQTQPIQL
jgi:hypothetical protein